MKRKFDSGYMTKGACVVCGKNNHQTSIWKVFEQDGWFRGDDIYIGKFCKQHKVDKYVLKYLTDQPKGGV